MLSLRISNQEYEKLIKERDKKMQLAKKKIKKGLTENQIQSMIRDRLVWDGWFVIRHQQGLGSLKGLSDLSAIKNGKTVYIEVKTPRGVLSQYQEKFKADIESHGGTYIVARSVSDIELLCKSNGV